MNGSNDVRESQSWRVLLVSKDASFLSQLNNALEKGGVGVTEARSRSAALGKLARASHPVVMLDADGLGRETRGVVAHIRKRYPDRVVFVAASHPTKTFLIELIRAGIHHFVPKPLDTRKAAHVIRTACERHEQDPAATTAAQREPYSDRRPGRFGGSPREILRTNEQLQIANESLRRQLCQLTILYQMGRDISENENWSDALDRFLMALVNYAKAEGAALLLFSRDGEGLGPRSSFHIDEKTLARACGVLGTRWRENPRGFEIHSIESYSEPLFNTCLERLKPWRLSVVPLRYRNLVWGFLLIEKRYRSNVQLRTDYSFLTTIQTILAEEVANASYISDLRQLSRFNEKVLDNTNSGVVTTDLEGYVVFWNHLALGMCPRLAAGARIHFDELFRSPAHRGGIFRSVMDSGVDTHVLEVTYQGENEREAPGRLGITKMHDDNLNGTVLVGIVEDLTEQKKLEAEIRRTDRLRVLGQLSAGMAHEIRNPLTGIATTAQVLARRLEGHEDGLECVRKILEETSRLDEIVQNLLSFAKPAKPQMRVCALAEVSERVVNLLSEQAAKKGIELRMRDDLGGSACMADSNQLAQVLLNLVLNAIDACGRGNRVEIVLSNEPGEEPSAQGSVRIDVVDDGPGVSPQIRERLFEPFVTTKTQGTGLGLAISQQIVEEHRGDIRCEFLEKGTRFTIRLPRGTCETVATAHSR